MHQACSDEIHSWEGSIPDHLTATLTQGVAGGKSSNAVLRLLRKANQFERDYVNSMNGLIDETRETLQAAPTDRLTTAQTATAALVDCMEQRIVLQSLMCNEMEARVLAPLSSYNATLEKHHTANTAHVDLICKELTEEAQTLKALEHQCKQHLDRLESTKPTAKYKWLRRRNDAVGSLGIYKQHLRHVNERAYFYRLRHVPRLTRNMELLEQHRVNGLQDALQRYSTILHATHEGIKDTTQAVAEIPSTLDVTADIRAFAQAEIRLQAAQPTPPPSPFPFGFRHIIAVPATLWSGVHAHQIKAAGLFCTPLPTALAWQKECMPSWDTERNEIPIIMEALLAATERSGGFQEPGIFVKEEAGAATQALRDQLESGAFYQLLSHKPPLSSPHLGATLLHQWLRNLPDPLFSISLYPLCISVAREDQWQFNSAAYEAEEYDGIEDEDEEGGSRRESQCLPVVIEPTFCLDGFVAVRLPSGLRHGRVAYIGPVQNKASEANWLGLVLDRPVGEHDGELEGVRYYDCAPRHGVFALPADCFPQTATSVADAVWFPEMKRIVNKLTAERWCVLDRLMTLIKDILLNKEDNGVELHDLCEAFTPDLLRASSHAAIPKAEQNYAVNFVQRLYDFSCHEAWSETVPAILARQRFARSQQSAAAAAVRNFRQGVMSILAFNRINHSTFQSSRNLLPTSPRTPSPARPSSKSAPQTLLSIPAPRPKQKGEVAEGGDVPITLPLPGLHEPTDAEAQISLEEGQQARLNRINDSKRQSRLVSTIAAENSTRFDNAALSDAEESEAADGVPDLPSKKLTLPFVLDRAGSTSTSRTTNASRRCTREHRKQTCRQVAEELLSTEVYYVSCLDLLATIFVPAVMRLKSHDRKRSARISPYEAQCLVSNISTLTGFHKSLLEEMAALPKDEPLAVASLMLKYADLFKLYSDYLNGYEDLLKTLGHLKSLKKWDAFLEQLDEDLRKAQVEDSQDDTHSSLSLMSFLIMPVQRVPRYVLLLNELKKQSGSNHPLYGKLQEALDKIKAVACLINDCKRRFENMTKLYSTMQKIKGLDADLMEPHRHLIRDGRAQVVSSQRSNKVTERHMYLFNDLLLYTTEKHSYKRGLVLGDPTLSFSFRPANQDLELVTNTDVIVMRITDDKERAGWVEDLSKAVKAQQFANGRESAHGQSWERTQDSGFPPPTLPALLPLEMTMKEQGESSHKLESVENEDSASDHKTDDAEPTLDPAVDEAVDKADEVVDEASDQTITSEVAAKPGPGVQTKTAPTGQQGVGESETPRTEPTGQGDVNESEPPPQGDSAGRKSKGRISEDKKGSEPPPAKKSTGQHDGTSNSDKAPVSKAASDKSQRALARANKMKVDRARAFRTTQRRIKAEALEKANREKMERKAQSKIKTETGSRKGSNPKHERGSLFRGNRLIKSQPPKQAQERPKAHTRTHSLNARAQTGPSGWAEAAAAVASAPS